MGDRTRSARQDTITRAALGFLPTYQVSVSVGNATFTNDITPCDGTPETAAEISRSIRFPGHPREVSLSSEQRDRIDEKVPGFLQGKSLWRNL